MSKLKVKEPLITTSHEKIHERPILDKIYEIFIISKECH